jgi:hypothetical protein
VSNEQGLLSNIAAGWLMADEMGMRVFSRDQKPGFYCSDGIKHPIVETRFLLHADQKNRGSSVRMESNTSP